MHSMHQILLKMQLNRNPVNPTTNSSDELITTMTPDCSLQMEVFMHEPCDLTAADGAPDQHRGCSKSMYESTPTGSLCIHFMFCATFSF